MIDTERRRALADAYRKEAAEFVGLYPNYACRVVQCYSQEGPVAVRDRRLEQRPPVRAPLLTPEQLQEPAEAAQVPAGIHLVFLPSFSPELQPAEQLWPLTLTNASLANRRVEGLDAAETVQAARCLAL